MGVFGSGGAGGNEERDVLQLEMRELVIIHSHTLLCDGAIS
jgi:hypothetical protein